MSYYNRKIDQFQLNAMVGTVTEKLKQAHVPPVRAGKLADHLVRTVLKEFRTDLFGKPAPSTYAEVKWTAEDVKTIRPKWNLARCEAELAGVEKYLRDRSVELGWEVLDTLLTMKGV